MGWPAHDCRPTSTVWSRFSSISTASSTGEARGGVFGFIIAASVLAALGRVVRIVVVACGNAQARLDRITGSARERISSAPAFPRTGRMAVLVMASAAVLFAFGTSASRSVTPSVATASTSPTPASRAPSPEASHRSTSQGQTRQAEPCRIGTARDRLSRVGQLPAPAYEADESWPTLR